MIGIVILSVIGVVILIGAIAAGLLGIRYQYRIARRRYRARQSGAPKGTVWPEHFQPKELASAWREPLEFEATTPCPHCGYFATHPMSQPEKDVSQYVLVDGRWCPEYWNFRQRSRRQLSDHPGAATKRNCTLCGHVWGEK